MRPSKGSFCPHFVHHSAGFDRFGRLSPTQCNATYAGIPLLIYAQSRQSPADPRVDGSTVLRRESQIFF